MTKKKLANKYNWVDLYNSFNGPILCGRVSVYNEWSKWIYHLYDLFMHGYV